jgi:hypothetical protein
VQGRLSTGGRKRHSFTLVSSNTEETNFGYYGIGHRLHFIRETAQIINNIKLELMLSFIDPPMQWQAGRQQALYSR